MPKFDTWDEQCKFYEKNFCANYLMPTVPALCRVDGRSFHNFTKGLKRPFDPGLSALMVETGRFLVEETHCQWAFVQSDEISLCWYSNDPLQMIFFDGKTQKIVSQTASLATYFFNKNIERYIPEKKGVPALFDSRCWNVPSLEEALVYAKWRQKDATKNAVSMAAQSKFSHKDLDGVNTKSKQEMLYSVGINFNDYPVPFKRGTFIRRIKRNTPFTTEEIDSLPPKHQARTNPDLVVERTVVECVDVPQLTKMQNPTGFLFSGEDPIMCNINKETYIESN